MNKAAWKKTSEYTHQVSADALPLSHERLVGAKATKLGSCDKHPAYS